MGSGNAVLDANAMRIDGCQHSFEHVANNELPQHFARLQKSLMTPRPTANFNVKGISGALLKRLGHDKDFKGCYVFVENERPFYVGISRGVVNRLLQHLYSKKHFSASLAFRMAWDETKEQFDGRGLKRAELMQEELFLESFERQQKQLRDMHVAYVELDCDLELYLFEVYAAMRLGTGRWNSFRTH